jgi:hypothetical protein
MTSAERGPDPAVNLDRIGKPPRTISGTDERVNTAMKRTRPNSRFRRLLVRATLIATLPLAGIWLGGLRWRLSFVSPGSNYELAVANGALRLDWIPSSQQGIEQLTFSPGFDFTRHHVARIEWLPSSWVRGCPRNVVVPMWIPTAAVLMLSALLWWPDLRARWLAWRLGPEHCLKCGYDLTGNVSGRCPECGKALGRIGSARPR